ncbi:FecCD family ABC transporter permease [Candidatus Symbiopectobacterium sp. NZEC135]|uniref:FecCD family ABC transporter permease n=1 Tax=Candidatus Symbiopectobacterium sp. NZEC135 TaxID=2820471 RepID=UPI002226DE63|nr:iron ABC transporter permease [Candidatus Symbiopectobacterium sp. NZEC135]MCW2479775.1 iron ABC transporter permease [Candidatus Symbiopectobacterium sp. NZEC135]
MANAYSLRIGMLSRRVDSRACLWNLALLGITLVTILLVLSRGTVPLSPWEVMHILLAPHQTTEGNAFIVWELRLPRIVLAVMVGGALALSGLILQSLVRNPLASPDLLGVTSGASAAAVAFLTFGAGVLGQRWMPLAAIAGAWGTALLIYLLTWRRGVSPYRLVLVGVGISALMGAVATGLLLLSPFNTTLSSYIWLTGSVYGANWQDVTSLAGWLALVAPLLALLARHVPIHELDDDVATSVGAALERRRSALLLLSVALAGTAIAHAGAIGFVGLIAPHMAKRLVGRAFVGSALATVLIGANLVVVSDWVGRTLFLPLDLPAGIFISALGSPFFLYLLIRQRHH